MECNFENCGYYTDGEIKRVDLGFWDSKGEYHPDWYIVDLRKE